MIWVFPSGDVHLVTASQMTAALRVVVRVTTHANVTGLAAGDRSLSAFAGEADRVVTVYARFTGGAFEEVTGHPGLNCHAANAAIAAVDSEGRIHAVAPGRHQRAGHALGRPVRLHRADRRAPRAVRRARRHARHRRAHVPHRAPQGHPVRARRGLSGPHAVLRSRRIVTRAMFQSRPYNRLSDRFHAIGVFQPSPERGITIGLRVVSQPGLAADERALWTKAPPPCRQIACSAATPCSA